MLRIATCAQLSKPDVDEQPLLEALKQRGVEASMVVWNDPAADWRGGVSVIRSTWDYYRNLPEFLAWAEHAAKTTRLWNPLEVIRWNSHKRYLLDFARRGLPVVPTALLPTGARTTLADLLAERGWTKVVVKPAVSAGSFETLRADASNLDVGEAHLARLLATRDVLVQPYVPTVDDFGERSVIWIDGELTHSIRKNPRFAGAREHVSETALDIARPEREAAERFVAAVKEPLLYARVDLARDERGEPMLMELELIEPSLFLRQSERALARLADAMAREERSAGTAAGSTR